MPASTDAAFRATITTPRETLQQVLDPPQTDITSESYTIGGVELGDPSMGLVTAAQVTNGRYLRGGREALVSATYAARRSLKVGSKLNLNGTAFTVVGLVEPPLGGQGVDVYLPLAQLQKLSGQKDLVNLVLVRADDGSSVAAVEKKITDTYSQAQVASAKDVAGTISGSLVDASNLSHSLGLALSIVAAAAAFLLAALLTLSSVGKRVRELGTLKALGWTQRLVVRQVAAESLAQGVLGGMRRRARRRRRVGGRRRRPLAHARARPPAAAASFGRRAGGSHNVKRRSRLGPDRRSLIVLGFGIALLGGLLAGAAGALRAARLGRPTPCGRSNEPRTS